ncbi:MAG: hypothetical protein Q9172_001715 [Xanthocarpia lactea]
MSTQSGSIIAPISIHIPPALDSFTVPLGSFLGKNPQYNRLRCAAFIFAPATCHHHHHAQTSQATIPPRLLLLRRSSAETDFPDLWEVPGGSIEADDPTVLHGLAREVFEETGLRLTRFVRLVGEDIKGSTSQEEKTVSKPGDPKRVKLGFEIEVSEIGVLESDTNERDVDGYLRSLPVTLDPHEHQDQAWVTEQEVRVFYEEGVGRPMVSKEQAGTMLEAFNLRRV